MKLVCGTKVWKKGKKKANPVPVEFQAFQSGLQEGVFSSSRLKDFFFSSQNQFLKLTNSCCFCTSDKDLQFRRVSACACVCMSRLDMAGVCVCTFVPVRACKAFMPHWHFGGRLVKVLSSGAPDPPISFLPYLLGDCALHRFFCPKPSLRSVFSLNFGEKCFPGAKGVIWSDSGSFQDQTKLGQKKEKKKKKKNWVD